MYLCVSKHFRLLAHFLFTLHVFILVLSLRSLHLIAYFFVFLSICLFVYLSVCLFVCLSVCVSLNISICLPISTYLYSHLLSLSPLTLSVFVCSAMQGIPFIKRFFYLFLCTSVQQKFITQQQEPSRGDFHSQQLVNIFNKPIRQSLPCRSKKILAALTLFQLIKTFVGGRVSR